MAKLIGSLLISLSAAVAGSATASDFWDTYDQKKEQALEEKEEQDSSDENIFVADASTCEYMRTQARSLKRLYDRGGTEADGIKSMGGANQLESWEWAYISYVGLYRDSHDVERV